MRRLLDAAPVREGRVTATTGHIRNEVLADHGHVVGGSS
jgi:hypothetical protein